MKSLITLVILLWSFSELMAQKSLNVDTALTSIKRIELGLQGFGVGYEHPIGNRITLDMAVGAGGAYWVEPGSLTYSWSLLQPALYVSVTPKWYFNREKRQRKGKSLALNAGNYLGLRTKMVTANSDRVDPTFPTLLMNLHWGLQRPLGGRWLFQTHAGVGVANNLSQRGTMVYPALDFRFSYCF